MLLCLNIYMDKIILIKDNQSEKILTLNYLQEYLLEHYHYSKLYEYETGEKCLAIRGFMLDKKFYDDTYEGLCRKVIDNHINKTLWVNFIKKRLFNIE